MQAAATQDGAAPYTLHEAAQLLGVSLNTVRRKISRGELRATQVPRPQGHMWHVWLERTQDATQHPTQGSDEHPTNGYVQDPASILPVDRAEQLVTVLAPLVEAAIAPLRAELADVRALLSAHDQELGAVRIERDQLADQLRALQKPTSSGSPLERDSEGSTVEPTQTPSETPRRAWWLRWWSS